MEDQLLDFFKTFSDANRLRIAALLLDTPSTTEEIAAQCRIRIVDVPRQLAQFEKMGLLIKEGKRYSIDSKVMERMSREVLSSHRPNVEAHSNDANADEFDRMVVKNYSLPNGRLKELPMQEKKLQAILRHVVQVFEPGVRYNEKEVNEALKRYHHDTASLRRYLVDYKMIEREPNGAKYWRE